MNLIKEIRQIVSDQARSLQKAKLTVGHQFQQAIQLIYKCQGKLIVTGVGKSGFVAQKIASTMTSTGTPSIYLHATEGMHGSLGVVHKNDIVLAIGKSGESEELLNILPSIRKIGAKIISLTANKESTLARQSSIVLHVPIDREVCPLNLAPTTSSTLFQVIGDAMAVVLMKMRGFDPQTFALYHPGGLLGKRLLLKVSDVMRGGKRNPVVPVTASMDRLLVEMTRKWAGAVSVVNRKGLLIGLVTDYDIRMAFAHGKRISGLSIIDIMNKHPFTIYADEMAIKALQIMEDRKKPLTVLPVIDRRKRSVGMIHLHDLVTSGLISSRSSKP